MALTRPLWLQSIHQATITSQRKSRKQFSNYLEHWSFTTTWRLWNWSLTLTKKSMFHDGTLSCKYSYECTRSHWQQGTNTCLFQFLLLTTKKVRHAFWPGQMWSGKKCDIGGGVTRCSSKSPFEVFLHQIKYTYMFCVGSRGTRGTDPKQGGFVEGWMVIGVGWGVSWGRGRRNKGEAPLWRLVLQSLSWSLLKEGGQ